MFEAVAVCVRALCGLGVNMPTCHPSSPADLLRRFPRPPNGHLEPPSLRDPRWRSETEALLRREDVLTDEARRSQIHDVIQQADWFDDLDLRRRVGDILLRT